MASLNAENPAELDARFLGYRLDVISRWPSSDRKLANAKAISRRLTAIARSALVRPDIEDLLHLSCRLLDDAFTAGEDVPGLLSMQRTAAHSSPEPAHEPMPIADW
ncbi:MAG TPA: hypothetical protein VMU80_23235 [Bryobacteraceae bacterium]|nr:hypothetical protein [Bryobacteraceae bacterium]HUO32153.1 hypothetical protein [Bryobacteraceae bacterium]